MLEFGLLLLLAIVAQANPLLGRYAKRIDASELSGRATYDFIIAGAGISGLTVADRLTEDPEGTVSFSQYVIHN